MSFHGSFLLKKTYTVFDKDFKDLTDEEVIELLEERQLGYDEVKKVYNTSATVIRDRVNSIDGYIHTPQGRTKHLDIEEFIEKAKSEKFSTIEELAEHFQVHKGRVKKLVRKHKLKDDVDVTKTYRKQKRIMEKLEESPIALQVIRQELKLSIREIVELTGVSADSLGNLCRERGLERPSSYINPLHLFVLYYVLELQQDEIAEVLGETEGKVKSWLQDYQYYNTHILRKAEKWVKDAYNILRDMSARKRAELRSTSTDLAEYINEIRRQAIKIAKKYPRQ